ncbi:peptidylprolyl isomerase [Campylobacter canadensis]|uniref:Peptidyl-prolyl cis-trans isomerase n=1 Tax=Campylobacter canadensis TaxID=449520 RepID=A0ABS7WSS2_9BACT|nr:peptidylprolyl isomerase [Campylobacter canadensis]MBZ7987836.1 peptidylprolyl isomerase [Campylobacter canadensis]MBZ7995209.1 peptidylprolyl isomerase [Campylobacter canadensis]MBZ7997226.1 peptidylprolyl isomerase [Campylobacter canadensis]MBZ7998845.1 peptidylprolyl isomerase [Campylobacter canadensis]MBZ8000773.1 peptidylprolyl isomerase [Campylobacter canadensis]
MIKVYDNLADLENINEAHIDTSKGIMKIKLFKDSPQATLNFAHLAQSGFYDNLTFHRVISNFVVQGGCPYGTGTGGPGWKIKCECENQEHKHILGTLSMAHAGPNTGGSQFFICLSEQEHLNGVHTIFGQIEDEESLKVLKSIRQNDTINTIKIL